MASSSQLPFTLSFGDLVITVSATSTTSNPADLLARAAVCLRPCLPLAGPQVSPEVEQEAPAPAAPTSAPSAFSQSAAWSSTPPSLAVPPSPVASATWPARDDAARRAGHSAARRFLGERAPVIPFATSARPQVYLVLRDRLAAAHRPGLRCGAWGECRPHVVEGPRNTLSHHSVFQGFPSKRELEHFEAGFFDCLDSLPQQP